MKKNNKQLAQSAWMNICNAHNFMYIRIPKTASRSIINTVIECNDVDMRPFTRIEDNDPHSKYVYPFHKSARQMRKLYPMEWHRAFKFAIIRHPLDRFISSYAYLQQNHILDNAMKGISFDEAVAYICNPECKYVAATRPQSHYVMDNRGQVIVDKLYLFDNLADVWEDIKQRTGVKGHTLPIINKTKRKHWSEYFSKEQESLFRSRFKYDFELYDRAQSELIG